MLFFAACSDSTAPANQPDLSPSYAKPAPPTTVEPAIGNLTDAVYRFTSGTVDVSAGTGIGEDTDNATLASSSADIQYAPSNSLNGFIGRYNNTHTRTLVVFPTAGSKYTADFDLYVIGSWDGKGKQAQHGVFLANVFQVAYRCGLDPTVHPIFTTTFSNQYTVQQDFPNAYGLGGFKAGTGSVPNSIDALGYRDALDADGNLLSNTPTFRSFGDVTYHFTYTLTNECGGATGTAPTFVFSTTAPGQQSNYDESWGLDNIILKADR
ncbi:MAG: hypothetical protein Q7S20_11015 [Gemmatimonadaceae bacterium]|nr:hypothetical protein [Gemmatimonadaceae bacterium]